MLDDWSSILNDKDFAFEIAEQYFNTEQPQFYPTIEQSQQEVKFGEVETWYNEIQCPCNMFEISDEKFNDSTPSPQRRRSIPQKRKRDDEHNASDQHTTMSRSEEDYNQSPTSPPPKKKYYKKKNVPLQSVEELLVRPDMNLSVTEIRGKYGKALLNVPLVTFDDCSWRATLSRKKNCVIVRSAVELPSLQLRFQDLSLIPYIDVSIVGGDAQHLVGEDGIHHYYLHFELKCSIDFAKKREIEGSFGKRGRAIPLYDVGFEVCDLNGFCYGSFTGGVKRRAK